MVIESLSQRGIDEKSLNLLLQWLTADFDSLNHLTSIDYRIVLTDSLHCFGFESRCGYIVLVAVVLARKAVDTLSEDFLVYRDALVMKMQRFFTNVTSIYCGSRQTEKLVSTLLQVTSSSPMFFDNVLYDIFVEDSITEVCSVSTVNPFQRLGLILSKFILRSY
jgi:hypothetical protein